MKWWLKFGCFLTGYNYAIVQQCSEVVTKTVKKYTAALVIVGIIWAFIGFTFANRYLDAGQTGSIAGAIILCIIIVQVERQIIMSIDPPKLLYWARGVIAFFMALIGSIIIDQIILKEDIEQKKIFLVDEKVNKILPAKSAELTNQIRQLDTAIMLKEEERAKLQADIVKNPVIQTVTTNSTPVVIDTKTEDTNKVVTTSKKVVTTHSITRGAIANPNIELLNTIDPVIKDLRVQKAVKDSMLLSLRPALEKEVSNRKGFLEELEVMWVLITESGVALSVWLIWVFILMGLEMFILFSKSGEKGTDYEVMIRHQRDMHYKKLQLLGATKM